MKTIISMLAQGIESYWFEALVTFLLLTVSFLLGQWRSRTQWRHKSFDGLLNVSLNSLADGTLHIRTLMEASLNDVFLNPIAVAAVLEAARQTEPGHPILRLPADQAWILLNLVLNEVSERFAAGFLRRDAGLPVTAVRYLLCLTYERGGPVRTQKVRAMLIQKALLLSLPDEPPQFEADQHRARWRTLRAMKRAYDKEPHLLIELELCF